MFLKDIFLITKFSISLSLFLIDVDIALILFTLPWEETLRMNMDEPWGHWQKISNSYVVLDSTHSVIQ